MTPLNTTPSSQAIIVHQTKEEMPTTIVSLLRERAYHRALELEKTTCRVFQLVSNLPPYGGLPTEVWTKIIHHYVNLKSLGPLSCVSRLFSRITRSRLDIEQREYQENNSFLDQATKIIPCSFLEQQRASLPAYKKIKQLLPLVEVLNASLSYIRFPATLKPSTNPYQQLSQRTQYLKEIGLAQSLSWNFRRGG